MITFTCKNRKDIWTGTIASMIKHGTHYEIVIQSRSSIMVLFGATTGGYFACMPDFNAGCHLARLNDKFWNTERLVKSLGKIDGITVATALEVLASTLQYPEF